MKNTLLTFFAFILTTGLLAQQKLKFTYDTAGNQILRDRVCATCLKAVLPQEIDSLIAEAPAEDLNNVANFDIVAYPNPVTNLLFVDWIPDPDLEPLSVQLFSLDSRQLASYTIRRGQTEQEVNFEAFPAGLYILSVSFKNGTSRSFKVIRT